MPSAQQLLAREAELQAQIRAQRRRFTKHSTGANARARLVSVALKDCANILAELEPLAVSRCTKIPSRDEQEAAWDEWYDFREETQQFMFDGWNHYQAMPDRDEAAQTNVELEIAAVKAKLTEQNKQAEADIAVLKKAFEEDWVAGGRHGDPAGMTKAQFLSYTERLVDVKKLIHPGLKQINDELCRIDLKNAPTLQTEFTKLLADVNIKYQEVHELFAALEVPELALNSSLASAGGASGVGEPAAASTGINRSLANLATVGLDVSRWKGYGNGQYKNGDPPKFYGDPAGYPLFKEEWTQSVQKGKDNAWIIRMLADSIKCADKSIAQTVKLCKTAAEAWEFLDRIFANPTIVSSRVVRDFMKLQPSDLKPFTPQSQLNNLNLKVKQLNQQLESVKQEAQFTQNAHLITFAINLLPELYHDFFSEKRHKAERDAKAQGSAFSDTDLYKLFTDFLDDKVAQFRQFQPDTLMKLGKSSKEEKEEKAARSKKLNTRRGGKKVGFRDPLTSDESASSDDDDPPPNLKTFAHLGGSVSDGKEKDPDWGTMVAVQKAWKKMGKCSVCKADGHYWKGDKGVFASSQMTDCIKFRTSSLEERIKMKKEMKLCERCTSREHQIKDCRKSKEKLFCRKMKDDGTPCKGDHASLFHGGKGIRMMVLMKSAPNCRDHTDVMLGITAIKLNQNYFAVTLLDNGSNSTIITHNLAERLGFKGRYMMQEVELCGKDPEVLKIKYYSTEVTVFDEQKRMRVVTIRLIGVDRITTNPGSYDVSIAYQIFPHIKAPTLDKPSGEVELLIGSDQIMFMPGGGHGKNHVGNLRVFDIPVPPYKILMGSHPQIKFSNPNLSTAANQWRTAVLRTPDPVVQLPGPLCLNTVNIPADFWEAETLGYDTPRKCNRCKNCQVCHILEEGDTVKAKLELQAMRDGISYDETNKLFTVKFPIVGDITQFKDNRNQAIVRAEALQKSLEKRKLLNAYNEQVDDFIERGVWKETSLAEIEAWKSSGGYVHYVGHHAVLNPQSKSTPVRVVVDSALRNNYNGPKLSSLYAKGPNCLNNLYSVLTTWRSFQYVGVFDVSKCYHGMKTGKPEFFMRLVVWRKEGETIWRIFGHTCVGFGDISASALLEVIFGNLAELGRPICSHTARLLEILRYVDDGLFGGTKEQIIRMRGNLSWVDDKPVFDGTITQILALASFKAKHICLSGETDPAIIERQGAVLGMDWDPAKDLFICKVKVNLSKKVGAGRKLPDLEYKDIPSIADVVFTRRLALQVASQIWDPLGLLVPYTMKLKILMKELVDHEKKWDEPLPEPFQRKWRNLVCLMVQTEPIHFPRSINLEAAVGRPEIIAFFDGSDQAFGAVVYIRWRTANPEQFLTNLVTSKGRVTPKGGTTTPRSELSGLIVAVRVISKVVRALSYTSRPIRVTVAGDSKCSVTAVDTNCAALNPYFANRALEVVEAQNEWGRRYSRVNVENPALCELEDNEIAGLEAEGTVVDKVQYLPGPQNPADWPSRGNKEFHELDLNSEWQQGPAFLRQKRENWPFSIDFLPSLPAEERRKRFSEVAVLNKFITKPKAETNDPVLFESVWRIMLKYTDITRAQAIVARVYRSSRLGDRSEVLNLENKDLDAGLFLMQFVAQRNSLDTLTARNTWESLALFVREGLVRARGRIGHRPLKHLIGHPDLVILEQKCPLAKLVMLAAHREDHRLGAGDAVFRSVKRGYWILQARRLADRVIKECMHCRTFRTETADQRMGDLPDLISKVPVRPFSHIALDFAGAMRVRSEVNKRATMKAFPLIFVCLNTGAIATQLCPGYDTQSFLTALQHFFAIRGRSSFIYTDMGSQITSASNKLDLADKGNMMEKEPEVGARPIFNFKKVKAATASHGVEWHHCPVQTQWRDGRSEAAVKSMKRSLRHLNPGDDLTFAEVSCLLARAANQVNERPLGVRHHQKGSPDLCVITPNLLLQGTRTCAAQDHSEEFDTYMSGLTLRLGYIEQCYQDWWHLWLTQVWPSLVPFRRWKTEHRNISVGDIVLVRYASKVAKPSFRLARVLTTAVDDRGKVRTVVVGFRPRSTADKKKRKYIPKPLEELTTPVQRLVVLLAVEEQELLPAPSNHKHTCPRVLKVPALTKAEMSALSTAGPTDSAPSSAGPTDPSSETALLQEDPEPEQDDNLIEEAVRLSVNHQRVRRPFNCWRCNHRQFLDSVAGKLCDLAPSPQ